MKVFVSWSGARSHAVAQVLHEWVTAVIQAARPWLSSEDIQRGAQWFGDIGSQLQESSVGIFCLTQKNKNAPWILFEAGAIAKGVPTNRICTLLIDLDPSDVLGPLAQFNHTKPNYDEMLKLASTLNAALGESRLTDAQLKKSFDAHWSSFESEIKRAIEDNPEDGGVVEKPDPDEMLSEVLSGIRGLNTRISRMERGVALDGMVGDTYKKVAIKTVSGFGKSGALSPNEAYRWVATMSESEKDLLRIALLPDSVRWSVHNGPDRGIDGDVVGPETQS